MNTVGLVNAVSSSSSPTTPTKLAKLGLDPPENVRSGSKEYYRELCHLLIEQSSNPLTADEISEIMHVNTTSKPASSKPTRLTQVWGSLSGKSILEKVKSLDVEKTKKEEAAMEKKQQKEKKITAFIRCEIRCVCEPHQKLDGKCAAFGLRKCSSADQS